MGKRTITLSQEQFCIEQGLTWQLADEVTINGPSSYLYGFITGPYWVQIDDRIFQTQSTSSTFNLYRDTAYTGGTALPLRNRNVNYRNDTAKLPFTENLEGVTATLNAANIIGSVTLDTAGQLERSIGDESSANIFLEPNTSHVFEVKNNVATNSIHRFSAHCTQWSMLGLGWKPVRQP